MSSQKIIEGALLLYLLLAASLTAIQGALVPLDMHITAGIAAYDCWGKPALLVNGQANFTITVTQGDTLLATVYNDLPANWPSVTGGVSIHWHGFSMRNATWYDGVGFIHQCPIPAGSSFTYQFDVNEAPGTYFWHDHSSNGQNAGLAGALIVKSPQAEPWTYDAEKVLVLRDWYHSSDEAQAMNLNRPNDPARVTPNSGKWVWADLAQSITINNNGVYLDCNVQSPYVNQTTCPVRNMTVPPARSALMPWASQNNPGCTHETIGVEAGKTYRLRIVAATGLTYKTVCFEGHNVTVIAADAFPVAPFSARCVDVNQGQRLDVLLTADQPVANYWFSVQSQYRTGSPAGYAVLHYAGAPNNTLPATPPPQPGSVQPWDPTQVVIAPELLQATLPPAYAPWAVGVPGNASNFQLPAKPDIDVLANITQPLLKSTGVLRWALNNVAQDIQTLCSPRLVDQVTQPGWLDRAIASGAAANAAAPGPVNNSVYVDSPQPLSAPVEGAHIVPLAIGQVVRVVMNNLPANANGGDYTAAGANRTATEQHPFHLHGHHFWVLGQGNGSFNGTQALNTVNPPFRDTQTLPQAGWTVIEFVADNPGMWLLHCHINFHLVMGQALTFLEGPGLISQPPADLPACPSLCQADPMVFTKAMTTSTWGASGFEVPLQ